MATARETTVEKEASLTGISLHSGAKVRLTVKPAPAGSGYQFRRMDLADQPTIPAFLEKVKQVERATTLAEGSVKVSTVEHLLSALRGLEIDNALIELDANEPPIGDGSAAPFLEMLGQAGRKELDAPRAVFEIREPVYVTTPDGGYMAALPHDGFKISCTNANHTPHHTQFLSLEIGANNYAKEIGRARTFVFYEEVEPLLAKGLIKGGVWRMPSSSEGNR